MVQTKMIPTKVTLRQGKKMFSEEFFIQLIIVLTIFVDDGFIRDFCEINFH